MQKESYWGAIPRFHLYQRPRLVAGMKRMEGIRSIFLLQTTGMDIPGRVNYNPLPIPISMYPQGQTSAQMWQPTHFS